MVGTNHFQALLFAVLLAASQLAAAQGHQGLVVFGTSLSDPGNAYVVLGEANTPPDWSGEQLFLVPDRPYARGGRHFSNGPTWIEQLARPLGLAASAKGAFEPGGGANFAFGGARAREGSSSLSPSLSTQVGAFLQATGGQAPAQMLYVIEMGGNDMRDALAAFPSGHNAILGDALTAIVANIQQLYAAGARQFLVWNMPNIGLTPAINPNAGAAFVADLLAQGYNGQLAAVLTALRAQPEFSELNLVVLDVYGKLKAITDSAQTFGLDNANEACISLSAPFSCAQPNDYLFWDGIHPTAAGHAILAHEAARVLAP